MCEVIPLPRAAAQKAPNPATVGRLPKDVVRPYELVWRRSRREEARTRAEQQSEESRLYAVEVLRDMLARAEAGELIDFIAYCRYTTHGEGFVRTGRFESDYPFCIQALESTANQLSDALAG